MSKLTAKPQNWQTWLAERRCAIGSGVVWHEEDARALFEDGERPTDAALILASGSVRR